LSEGKFNKQQMHYMFSAGPLAMATWSRGMEMGLERTRLSEEPSAKREPRPCQTHWGTSTPFTYAAHFPLARFRRLFPGLCLFWVSGCFTFERGWRRGMC